jgi:signal peptidase I
MRRLGRICFAVLLAAGLALIVMLFAVPRLAGYRTFVVIGRSMTGTISIGSLIYSDPVPVESLRVGDIITFQPPEMDEVVTHRIVAITRASDGTQRISTQGDAVPNRDPWQFKPLTADLPRYVFAIPVLGYAVGLLSLPLVRMLVFALPAIIIALVVLTRLWRQSGEEAAAPPTDSPRPTAASPSAPSAVDQMPSPCAAALPVRVWDDIGT